MPKTVVITGYYNRAGLIPITLGSLFNQTTQDFEALVFDDASQDDTIDQFDRFVEKHAANNFRIATNAINLGFTQTLRKTIDGTDSKYIAIVGSGDTCEPTRIEKQARVLDDNPEVVLVGSHFRTVFSDGRVVHRRPNHDDVDLAGLRKSNGISHGEVMFRRDAYERTGGYRPGFRFSADYDLWLRLIQQGRFHTIPELLYDRHAQLDGASYHPDKFAQQARYAILARDFAALDSDAAAYDSLVAEGPDALVPRQDPRLQQRLLKGALRNLILGDRAGARGIAQRYLVPGPQRAVLMAVLAAAGLPGGEAAITLARRLASRSL